MDFDIRQAIQKQEYHTVQAHFLKGGRCNQKKPDYCSLTLR